MTKKNKRKITLAEGSGGKESAQLIEEVFAQTFRSVQPDDAAILNLPKLPIVFATDSHVVKPLFFKGGDIGKLSVFGTVNDLAVMGAKPLYLTCSVIIEEGFAYETLKQIALSMATAAKEAQVQIVTGDTKVVGKGECDGIFLNTAGIGIVANNFCVADSLQEGDAVIISGTIAEHGLTIYSEREGMVSSIASDTQSIYPLVEIALGFSGLRIMRDPTRGGLAAVLHEFAQRYQKSFFIEEEKIPLSDTAQTLCDMLGFDPLHIANEGKIVAVIEKSQAQELIHAWQKVPQGKMAAQIGMVTEKKNGRVILKTNIGGERMVDDLLGEMLPRIC